MNAFSSALGFCFPLLEVRCPCWAARSRQGGGSWLWQRGQPKCVGACAEQEQKAAPLSREAQGGSRRHLSCNPSCSEA